MNFNPRNILIINFGQLGDVVLSLPALGAIRRRFPDAKITVAVGKSCAKIIDLARVADDKIVVDRVKLRDSGKLWSIYQILRLVKQIRTRKFDFVIDLHSLSETNILAFLSGAEKRLFMRRENRSIDLLANFAPRPVREDRTKHATDRYLDAIAPLGIVNVERAPKLFPLAPDLDKIEKLWTKHKIDAPVAGIFPGAGHESRRWSLDNFAQLADFLARNEKLAIVVFLGPEEKHLAQDVKQKFPAGTIVFDDLTLTELIAAQARLSLFITNDTGPLHLAASVGAAIVLIMENRAPLTYLPLIENLRVVRDGAIDEISVETVYHAAQELLKSSRTAVLLA